jgi:hypothetical protein
MDDINKADVSELESLWVQLSKRYTVEQPRMLEKALENGSKRLPSHLTLSKVASDCIKTLKSLMKQGEDPALKYSSLPLNALLLPETFSIHELAGILKEREYRTQNILKHGVAPYVSFTPNKVGFFAEDSKGRNHEILSFLRKTETTPVNFMIKGETDPLTFDNGNVAVANAMNIESANIYSPYGEKLKNKLLKILDKGVVVTPGTFLFEHAKKAFFERPGNITFVKLDGHPFEKGKIPIPTGSNPAIAAQINKLEPTLIPYLTNAMKKGPTQRTLNKLIYDGLALSTPQEQAKAIITSVKKQSKGEIDMINRENDWVKLLSKNWESPTKANVLSREILHHQHGFDVKADDTPKTKAPKAPKKDATPKNTAKNGDNKQSNAKTAPETNVQMKNGSKVNIDAALSAFYQNRENASPGQLSVQVLAAMSPNALIPMSADEIKDFTNSVETIQKQPVGAEDGIRWLAKTIEHKLPDIEKPKQEEHSFSYRRSR